MKTVSILLITLCLSTSAHALLLRDIAIYNDTDETQWPEGGAWLPLVNATQVLVNALGYSWEFIDADDVNNNDLGEYYRMIIFPGGWAGGYNEYINQTGYQNIRDFISEGGAYLGMCAGSFFVSDKVLWRENTDASSVQNVYDYPLDIWPGISDGAIIDFQAWDSSAETGCFSYPGARMVDITLDQTLMPEANPSVRVLYYGGPIYRPPNGKWTNEKVIARYDMPGFSGHEEPAMMLFPYGSGRVFLSAVHPELSLNESNCSLYYDITARSFLAQIIVRMMAEPEAVETQIEMGRTLRFETVLGLKYQIESSADAGDTWQSYGDPIEADSFKHIAKIAAADAALEFRITLVQ